MRRLREISHWDPTCQVQLVLASPTISTLMPELAHWFDLCINKKVFYLCPMGESRSNDRQRN